MVMFILGGRDCYGISPHQGVNISDMCMEHPERCPAHRCTASDSQYCYLELKVTRLNMCHLSSSAGELFSIKGHICQELKSLGFL